MTGGECPTLGKREAGSRFFDADTFAIIKPAA